MKTFARIPSFVLLLITVCIMGSGTVFFLGCGRGEGEFSPTERGDKLQEFPEEMEEGEEAMSAEEWQERERQREEAEREDEDTGPDRRRGEEGRIGDLPSDENDNF